MQLLQTGQAELARKIELLINSGVNPDDARKQAHDWLESQMGEFALEPDTVYLYRVWYHALAIDSYRTVVIKSPYRFPDWPSMYTLLNDRIVSADDTCNRVVMFYEVAADE